MSKQFGIDGAIRDRSTIHSNIGTMFPATKRVNNLREHLFPCTTLSGNQYTQVGRSHLPCNINGSFKFRIGTNNRKTLFYLLNLHVPSDKIT